MIPYEELERALARWKARRSGAVEPAESAPQADETPSGLVVLSSTSDSAEYAASESTGEIALGDGDVHHE